MVNSQKILEHSINKALRAACFGDVESMKKRLDEAIEISQKGNNRKKSLEVKFNLLREILKILNLAEETLRRKAEKAANNPRIHRYCFFRIEELLKEKEKIKEKLFPQIKGRIFYPSLVFFEFDLEKKIG